jgi:CheY-like chemotaxis protein
VTRPGTCRSLNRVTDRSQPRHAGRKGAKDPHVDVTGALHDVSNALTVVLGWVAEARAADASGESIGHALAVIEQRARAARDLARRAIGAEPAIIDGEASLDVVLSDVLDALAVEAQRSRVELTRRGTASALVPMPADVSQIVTNLIMNALAHAPAGSDVSVEVASTAHTVTIEVQDQGSGIMGSRSERIFDGDSERSGGAGVGLQHSRALARAGGGDLVLAPSATRGARFRLTWPRAEAIVTPPPSAPSPPLLKGKRVLVVEDDAHVTLLLETALGARGATVSIARNPAEIAQMLAEGVYDAALIDLSPIASDVGGALAALRKRSPGATLVFISGSATGMPSALEGEGVRWIRKPFEVSELVAAVMEGEGRK